MKVKRIIEIEEYHIKELQEYCKGEHCGQLRFEIISSAFSSIAHSTPYNPTGDAISRSVLDEIRQLYKKYQPNLATEVIEFGNALEELIDNAQAVDLWQMRQEATENALKKAEVLYGRPKGEWIECRSSDHWKCDKCGHPAPLESRDCEWLSNFCPDCGADMRTKENDND